MDISVIPKGPYCYNGLIPLEDKPGFKLKYVCPYWKYRSEIDNIEVHSQNYGYCLYLGKGDIEMNAEERYTLEGEDISNIKTADELGLPLSLLWDMCKMCGINDEWIEEDEC